MFRSSILFVFIICLCSVLPGCSRHVASSGRAKNLNTQNNTVASPPCLIYKTRADYTKNVPVILSEDKSAIISYPDVKDVYFKGALAYPTRLNDGFLLDNRGIGLNVAFLKITYEEYSVMDKTLSASELMTLILDKDPLTELYQCGLRSQYADPEKEMNGLISSGKINSCKRLK